MALPAGAAEHPQAVGEQLLEGGRRVGRIPGLTPPAREVLPWT